MEGNPFYSLNPAIGAFDISYKGRLLWSKRARGKWPNLDDLAKRCVNLINAIEAEKDDKLAAQYLFENFDHYKIANYGQINENS